MEHEQAICQISSRYRYRQFHGKGVYHRATHPHVKAVADTLEELAIETGGMLVADSTSCEVGVPADWKASISKKTPSPV
jgi:hypothetical protein